MHYYGIGKGEEDGPEEPLQEQHEDLEESKEGQDDENVDDHKQEEPQTHIRLPPLNYERPKRRPRMSQAQLKQMQQLRRWDVRITKISIENLTTATYDAFIEFVIGGDQRVVIKQTKGGEKMVKVGALGYSVKTEVNSNLEYKKCREFHTSIRHEHFASYFNILEQHLRIDVWDWEKWGINSYLARVEVPLQELASGNVSQEHVVCQVTGKKKKNLCKVRFQCLFQEIWDFFLTLSDWSVSNIMNEEGEQFDPSLMFCLKTFKFNRPTLTTKVMKRELNPQWPVVTGGMNFRGTLHDLENLRLEITLFNGTLAKKVVGTRTIQLRGIVDSGTIKADIVQRGRQSTGHVCFAKGRITISSEPKYRQLGEILHLSSKEQYLCVKVMRIDNLLLPSERGVVNSFVTVEWGNQVKTSRVCYDSFKPIYNEVFHFPIIISSKLSTDRVKRSKAILNELTQRNSILFSAWAADEEGFNDSLGSVTFSLSELQTGKAREITFYDDDFENYTFMKVKVKSCKKQLTSPFFLGGSGSFIYFEVYLLYDHEADIVFEDIPVWEDKEDLLEPEELSKAEDDWLCRAQELRDYFAEEQERCFRYKEKDERDREHFLPFYLSKMSLPVVPKSRRVKALLETEEIEEKVKYFPTKSLKALLHWVSLIPFAQNPSSDVWTSPEFLMNLGKGDIEEHALMLGCLFLGFNDPAGEKLSKSTELSKTALFDKRVYVVSGTLKLHKSRHIWVMTIDDDYRGVTFWETANSTTFQLACRVKDPIGLRQFCIDGTRKTDLLKTTPIKPIKEVNVESESVDFEYYNESLDEAPSDPDNEYNFSNKPYEQAVKISDIGSMFSRLNLKEIGQAAKTDHLVESRKNFIELKADKDMADEKKFLENFHQPRLLEGANEIELPYRTIDVIFNHQNVYMNMQHFDPTKILYDLEDTGLWTPFLTEPTNSKPFYSSPSFAPPLNYSIVEKLAARIVKELKLGISALRSGSNLGTSWKGQSDKVVAKMDQLLVILEQEMRGDLKPDEARELNRNWVSEIRLLMPEGFRFSGKPAHFNFAEPDRIRNVMLDEGGPFFKVSYMQNEALQSKFAIAVKVFPYVGRVISIRVIVAVFFPKPVGS